MIPLSISLNLETNPFDPLPHPDDYPLNVGQKSAALTKIGLLPRGTRGGLSTVMMEVVLPDGQKVMAETTLRLFRTASAAILASTIAEREAHDPNNPDDPADLPERQAGPLLP